MSFLWARYGHWVRAFTVWDGNEVGHFGRYTLREFLHCCWNTGKNLSQLTNPMGACESFLLEKDSYHGNTFFLHSLSLSVREIFSPVPSLFLFPTHSELLLSSCALEYSEQGQTSGNIYHLLFLSWIKLFKSQSDRIFFWIQNLAFPIF